MDHVNSAITLHNLGLVYKNMADWVSAKSYFERAAQLSRQCRGTGHEFTIKAERELTYVINTLNNSHTGSTGTTKTKWWKLGHRKQ